MNTREKTLRQAAANGQFETVRQLHTDGININSGGPDSGKTALHWAAENGHLDIADFLIARVNDINCQDNKGNTPFHYVCESDKGSLTDKIEIIKHLLDSKADPLLANNDGKTPFMAFLKIRDNSQLASRPTAQGEVRDLIRKMKMHVAEVARTIGVSARIRPTGEVIFDTTGQLIADSKTSDIPASGQVSVNMIDRRSSFSIKLAPHK